MFDKLYDDITILILVDLYGKPASSLTEWKKKLCLLNVCRKWRTTLLPYVYSQLFVEFKRNHKRKEQLRTKLLTEFVPHYLLEENVELAVDNGYASMVNSIYMQDRFNTNLDEAMRKFTALIEMGPKWNVKSVQFSGSFESRFNNEEDRNKFSVALILAMPHLTKITIDTPHKGISQIFYDLIKVNSNSLIDLRLNGLPSTQPLEFTDTLTRLSISCAHLDPQKFKISVDVLKTLELFDVAPLFTWEFFAKDANEIVFRNLNHLSVSFRDDNGEMLPANAAYIDRHAFPYKLSFPKLKTLTANGCPLFITPLHRSTFPKELGVVVLSGLNGRLICLDQFAFRNVDCLKIYAPIIDAYRNEAFYDDAEKLFTDAFVCRQRILVIYDCAADLVKLKSCTNLSRVEIKYLRQMEQFYTMATSLPAGCEIDIMNFNTKIEAPDNEAQVLSQSLGKQPCSARCIRVSFNPDFMPIEKASLLVTSIMCSIKNAPELIVPAPMLTRLDDFAVKNMATHPFLLDVNLSGHYKF